MNQINLLRETLKPHLGGHGARLNFLSLFLIALIRVKTINLAELATGFRTQAKTESSYQRLQRFFSKFDVDYAAIARVIVGLMNIPQPWVLSIDRTEWSYGKTRFNIFMLGLVHQGVAYPVVWKMLKKKGNSNSDERMDLLDRFQEIFPKAHIAYVCADREFVGKSWLTCGMQVRACEPELLPAHSLTYLLIDPVLPFRLRIRESEKIGDGKKQLRAAVLFSHLLPGQTTVLSSRRWVWGRLVYVAGLRLEDGDLLVVIASDSPSTMITDYAHRWGIETCGMQVAACEPEVVPARSATLFSIFKTRGFCLESTHFTEPERLSKLLALMSLALCWAVKTGEWLHQHQPLKLKKHGRLSKSIFRYGLDYLRSLVTDLDLNSHEFVHSLQFLSCT